MIITMIIMKMKKKMKINNLPLVKSLVKEVVRRRKTVNKETAKV